MFYSVEALYNTFSNFTCDGAYFAPLFEENLIILYFCLVYNMNLCRMKVKKNSNISYNIYNI